MAKRKPRPHQKEAINASVKHFKKHKKGRLIMACGTGKTLTSLWIAESLKAKKILITVPSINLSAQNLTQWRHEYDSIGKHTNFLIVCSDETVGIIKNDLDEIKAEIPVTTEHKEIAKFAKSHKEFVIITTYASSDAIIKAINKIQFDLAIHDEAHRTAGAEGKLTGQLIHDRNVKTNRRLFMTATERLYSGVADGIISMDNEDVYGAKFYELDFRTAIQRGILCDYEIKIVYTTDTKIKDLINDNFHIKDTANGIEDKMKSLAAATMLLKDFASGKIHRCITFHNSIAGAMLFDNTINTINKAKKTKVVSKHINGTQPSRVRTSILSWFSTTKNAVVTNARTLTEGQDIPSLDAIAFIDKRNSVVDIAQSLGRAIRIDKNRPNKRAIVYLPIYEEGQYADMLRILRDLIMIDDKLRVSVENGGNKSNRMVNVESDIAAVSFDSIFKSVKSRQILKTTTNRSVPFNVVEAYIQKHGIKTMAQYRRLYKDAKLPLDFPSSLYGYPEFKNSKLFKDSRDRYERMEWAPLLIIARFCNASGRNIKTYNDYLKWWKAGKLPKNFPQQLKRYPEYTSFADLLGTSRAPWKDVEKYIIKNKIESVEEYKRLYTDGKLPKGFISSLYMYKEYTSDIFKSDFEKMDAKDQVAYIQKWCKSNNVQYNNEYVKLHKAGKLPKGFPLSITTTYGPEYKFFIDKKHAVLEQRKAAMKSVGLEAIKMFCIRNGIRKFSQYQKLKNIPAGYPLPMDLINFPDYGDIRPYVLMDFTVSAEWLHGYCKKNKIKTREQYWKLFHEGKLPIACPENHIITRDRKYGLF